MNRSKKIAFIVQDLCGQGAQRATATVIRGFVARGYEIDLLITRARYGSSYCTLKRLREKADYDEGSVSLKGFLKMKDWAAIRIELRNEVDRALGVPIITVSC